MSKIKTSQKSITKRNDEVEFVSSSSVSTDFINLVPDFKNLSKNYIAACESLKYISGEYDTLMCLNVTLIQTAEKYRIENEKYKQKFQFTQSELEKSEDRRNYLEAQIAMKKKWIKTEIEMREKAEAERDNYKQIVQLCKELIEDDPIQVDYRRRTQLLDQINTEYQASEEASSIVHQQINLTLDDSSDLLNSPVKNLAPVNYPRRSSLLPDISSGYTINKNKSLGDVYGTSNCPEKESEFYNKFFKSTECSSLGNPKLAKKRVSIGPTNRREARVSKSHLRNMSTKCDEDTFIKAVENDDDDCVVVEQLDEGVTATPSDSGSSLSRDLSQMRSKYKKKKGKSIFKKKKVKKFEIERLSLVSFCRNEGEANNNIEPMVPSFLKACIYELVRITDFIYLQPYKEPGNKYKVMALNDSILYENYTFDQCRKVILKIKDNSTTSSFVSTITSCIKTFLARSLLEPLLTFKGLSKIVTLLETKERTNKVYNRSITDNELKKQCQQVLEELPKANIDTLSLMMLHLQQICQNFQTNKMTYETLSSCIAMPLIGLKLNKPSIKDIQASRQYQPKIFKILITMPQGFYKRYYPGFNQILSSEDFKEIESTNTLFAKAKNYFSRVH